MNSPATRPTVAVGCFVFSRSSELLMIQRGKNPGYGLWTIPGGRVEFGESLLNACQREVFEETGIEVEVGPLVTIFEPVINNYHYVIIDYLGVPTGPSALNPVAGDDAHAARWVAMDKLSELSLTTDLLPVARQALALANERGLIESIDQIDCQW